MMHRNAGSLIALGTLALLTACTASTMPMPMGCPQGDLATRLAAARAGEVVMILACDSGIGHFVVPAGVTLVGPGMLEGDGATAVTLETAAGSTTTLRDVTIVSAMAGAAPLAGIESRGDGTAHVESVTVQASVGVGVALAALRNEVVSSHVHGEVTTANGTDARWMAPRASVEATHGVLVSRGTLVLTGSNVSGFPDVALSLGASQGAMVVGPVDAMLTTSTIGTGLGVGIASSATTLSMQDITIDGVRAGMHPWTPHGVLLVSGAVTSQRLAITNGDGFGIVEIAGSAHHSALTVQHMGDAGVWVGTGVGLTIMGASQITDTGFSALTAIDATSVVISDTQFDGVRLATRTIGARGPIDVGDALDLIGTSPMLTRVTILDAARAGIVLDHATGVDPSRFVNVNVTTIGTALGAVIGDVNRAAESFTPMAVAGWDTGITRMGTAAANDAAATTPLAIAVAPMPPATSGALAVIAPMY